MSPDFSTALAIAATAVVLAGGVFVLLPARRDTPQPPRRPDPAPQPGDSLTIVQFELPEIPAIANLLGPQIAAELLATLARKVSDLGIPAAPPEIGVSAITVSFAGNRAAVLVDQISAIAAILAGTVPVAGTRFSCTVRRVILHDGTGGALSASAAPVAAAAAGGTIGADDGSAARLDLLRNLQTGMANGEVALAYQPKLDLRTNAITSAEALLRWTRPDGQLVNTGELVALCEQTGTIKELTCWTLARAIADNEQFLGAGYPLLVYVNVSGALLADADFADHLLAMVSQTRAQIGIEITETAVIADPDTAIANLNRFAQAGIAIAIDDFGAGLSSLEYLQRLPASELKIDRMFIAELSSSHRNPLIIRATIDLAHALDMRVTAEGVDDQLSMALLKIMGCDMAQGYLISRPLNPNRVIDFLFDFNAASGAETIEKATY